MLNRWIERSEEHTSELQSRVELVCGLLLEKKKSKSSSLARMPAPRLGASPYTRCERRLVASLHRRSTLTWRSAISSVTINFFFNVTETPEISTLSLHDALPI